jgi:flagellar hook-associated protein 2
MSTSSTTSTAAAGYLNTVSSFGNSDQSLVTMNGLESGIDTTSIVNEMMSVYAEPQQMLSTQLATVQQNIAIYGGLSSDFTQLQTAADAISQSSDWQSWQANSSSAAVTATAGPGAVGGAASFSVNSLASAASLISAGAVTSTSATVASGNILLAQGGTALGFASFSDAGQTLSPGGHTI